MSGGGDPCTVRSKLNKFEHVWGVGPYTQRGPGLGPCMVGPTPMNRKNDKQIRLKTLPTRNLIGRR